MWYLIYPGIILSVSKNWQIKGNLLNTGNVINNHRSRKRVEQSIDLRVAFRILFIAASFFLQEDNFLVNISRTYIRCLSFLTPSLIPNYVALISSFTHVFDGRLFLSFQLHRHVGEQRGLRSMHASPKGWREPGSKRGRKRWKRETNGEESARGKKLEGAAGVEDGIDPYQTTLRPTTQG